MTSERVTVGAHQGRLWFLGVHTEMETVMEGLVTVVDCDSIALSQRFVCGHFCSDPQKRQGKQPENRSSKDQFSLIPSSRQGAGQLHPNRVA